MESCGWVAKIEKVVKRQSVKLAGRLICKFVDKSYALVSILPQEFTFPTTSKVLTAMTANVNHRERLCRYTLCVYLYAINWDANMENIDIL